MHDIEHGIAVKPNAHREWATRRDFLFFQKEINRFTMENIGWY